MRAAARLRVTRKGGPAISPILNCAGAATPRNITWQDIGPYDGSGLPAFVGTPAAGLDWYYLNLPVGPFCSADWATGGRVIKEGSTVYGPFDNPSVPGRLYRAVERIDRSALVDMSQGPPVPPGYSG